MGCKIAKVDVNYKYVQPEMGYIVHAIKYMSRPLGIDKPWKLMNHLDIDMIRFLVVELKGLVWVRYWGKKDKNIKDGETMKEITKKIDEPVKYLGVITKDEFFARYRMNDLEILGDGLFCEKLSESEIRKRKKDKKKR